MTPTLRVCSTLRTLALRAGRIGRVHGYTAPELWALHARATLRALSLCPAPDPDGPAAVRANQGQREPLP